MMHYIYAGNMRQAEEYGRKVVECGICAKSEIVCVNGIHALMGIHGGVLVRAGTWWDRNDRVEILEAALENSFQITTFDEQEGKLR